MRPVLVLFCLLALAGCEILPGGWTPEDTEGVLVAREAPIATHEFPLPPADQAVVGKIQVVLAREEDTLSDLARLYNLGYEEIRQANPGVDPWLPGDGTEVVLPTQFTLPDAPREGIVLNLASMRFFYYPEPEGDEPPKVITHPIGIGRIGWATPTGSTGVTYKATDPVWWPPPSIRAEHREMGDPLPAKVPPGPDNPLGEYVLGLGMPGYLIHGTNKPYGVGMRVSHGCIRLYPEDIQKLFDGVSVGTPVHIVDQPYLVGWLDGALYLEAHRPLQDDEHDWEDGMRTLVEHAVARRAAAHVVVIDWEKVEVIVRENLGLPAPIFLQRGGVDPLRLAALPVENQLPEGANWDGVVEIAEIPEADRVLFFGQGGPGEGAGSEPLETAN